MPDDAQKATIQNVLQIGINHHNAGQLSRAKQYYQQVLGIDEAESDANNLYGLVLVDEGEAEEALTYIQRALDQQPQQPGFWRTKGLALKALERHGEAADALWRAQGYQEALKEIDLAIGEDDSDYMLYLTKGRIFQDLGQPRDAEAAFRRAQDLCEACQNPYPDDQPDPPVYKPMKVNEELEIGEPNLQTQGFTYVIDIVGTCNLRCPSCPVGNTPRDQREIGFMDVKMYEQILDKIDAQGHKHKPQLWLFNWGEPLIHPDIGKIIRMSKQRGYHVFLSSNLNVDDGLKDAIKEHPDQLKISLSGFSQDVYCQTHSKGHIDRVKGNMYMLKYYLERYNAPTWVWVSYHMYRHNLHEYARMEQFSQELGFTFNPITAFYQPLERLEELYEGTIPDSEQKVLDLLVHHPIDAKIMKMPYYRKAKDCELRYNMISINFNGIVDLCCSSFADENTIGVNYLDADFDEIQRLKYEHPFCATCYKHGMNYQDIGEEGNRQRNDAISIMLQNAQAAPARSS